MQRRVFLKLWVFGSIAQFIGIKPLYAAWQKEAFQSRSVDNLFKAMSVPNTVPSADIELDMPDIAVGSSVPISVISRIPGTQTISIIVSRNQEPLAASFHLTKEMESNISLDIGVEKTSQVMVLVQAEEKYYTYGREIKIAAPGCR